MAFLGKLALLGVILALFAGCPTRRPPPPDKTPPPGAHRPKPYKVMGKWYTPLPDANGFRQRGLASWYGKKFHGRKTANGETYDMYEVSAAHKTLPLGTVVRVHNLDNDGSLDVRINDRGPFVRGRIIDLSYAAAKKLGVVGPGTARVEITALGYTSGSGETAASRPSAQPFDPRRGNFTFQIGAFKERKNAERLREKLDQKYKNAHISVYDAGDEIFYRVRVGRCFTLDEADEFEGYLVKNGFPDAFTIAE
ncbi:MAG: septal ring lytic transglycosylase RlpA family protein [Desulfobacterales bacterium]|nr:septal ring lytic transglycosylase RlpA family protein [Desulfobacterales bacterium]